MKRRDRRRTLLAATAVVLLAGAALLWVPGPVSAPARGPDAGPVPVLGAPDRDDAAGRVRASVPTPAEHPGPETRLDPAEPPGLVDDPASRGPHCLLSLRVTGPLGTPIGASVTHGPAYRGELPDDWTATATDGLWQARVPLAETGRAWQVLAQAPGHRPGSLVVPFLPEGSLDLGELRLGRSIRVEGQVLDSAGGPLEGARVQVLGVRRSVSHSAVRSLSEVTLSDVQGRFAVELAEVVQAYDLKVSAWHAELGGPFEAALADPTDGTLAPVTVRFGTSSAVRGYVARRDGTRLPGVTVSPSLPPQRALADVLTDASGRYEIPLAEGHTVQLTYHAEGLVPLDPEPFSVSAPARDVDLLMVLESRLRLEVRDALDGAPVPTPSVSFCSDSWGYGRCHEATGDDGWIERGGLPPGTWSRLRVTAPGYHEQELPDQLVSEGQVVGPLLVRLMPRAVDALVGGRVVDDRGRPVAGAVVSALVPQEGGADTTAAGTTGSDGSFALGPLPSGELTLQARDEQGRRAEPLTGSLTSAGWSGVVLRLEPPAVLEGQVLLAGRLAAAGALIRLEPVGRPGPATPHPVSAVADDQGRFQFTARPGRYRLSAWQRLPGQSVAVESPPWNLELGPGERRWLDVPLTLPALTVAGRVLATQPSAGWTLRWRYTAGLLAADWSALLVESHVATAGLDGDYLLEGVRPGVYEVTIRRADDSLVATQALRVETSLEPEVILDLHVPDEDG